MFPNRRPQQRIPSIDEILPVTQSPPTSYHDRNTRNGDDVDDNDDGDVDEDDYSSGETDRRNVDSREDSSFEVDLYPETLQSVESEHLDLFYDNRFEGRSLGVF